MRFAASNHARGTAQSETTDLPSGAASRDMSFRPPHFPDPGNVKRTPVTHTELSPNCAPSCDGTGDKLVKLHKKAIHLVNLTGLDESLKYIKFGSFRIHLQ